MLLSLVHGSHVPLMAPARRYKMVSLVTPLHRFWLLLLLSVTLCLGCIGEESDLSIEICSDFTVPDDLQGLRITVLDNERNTLHVTVHELLLCPEDRIRPLPQTVRFLDAHPDAALVAVAGLQDDVVVVRTERRLDERGRIRINLPRSCQGMQCSLGQACVAGQCQWTPTGTDLSCTRGPEPDEELSSEEPSGDDGEEEDGEEEDGEEEEPQEPGPRYCPPEDE